MHSNINKILGTVPDKNANNVVVYYADQIQHAPNALLAFYYRNMADLLDAGYASSQVEIHNQCKAIYVKIDNKIVGTCVFDWFPTTFTAHVVFTAIDKEYRGRGLYRIIFDFWEKQARELGARQITSEVNVNNTDSLNARKSVGMLPVTIITRKQLM